MFIVPTKKRFKSQTAQDAPKRISQAGKSRAELEILGHPYRESLAAHQIQLLTLLAAGGGIGGRHHAKTRHAQLPEAKLHRIKKARTVTR